MRLTRAAFPGLKTLLGAVVLAGSGVAYLAIISSNVALAQYPLPLSDTELLDVFDGDESGGMGDDQEPNREGQGVNDYGQTMNASDARGDSEVASSGARDPAFVQAELAFEWDISLGEPVEPYVDCNSGAEEIPSEHLIAEQWERPRIRERPETEMTWYEEPPGFFKRIESDVHFARILPPSRDDARYLLEIWPGRRSINCSLYGGIDISQPHPWKIRIDPYHYTVSKDGVGCAGGHIIDQIVIPLGIDLKPSSAYEVVFGEGGPMDRIFVTQ